MLDQKEELAKLDTLEMWMLYSWALWDVSKTATWINYVAEKAEEWLKPIEFNEGWISWKRVFEPLWVLYSISPWNFPYNQVFRNATSNIMAWNVVLSKHASNVVGVARKIEELFLSAGFPEWVYQNIEISSSESEYLISHKSIKWVNITGWDRAWRAIWELSWKNLKPSILELGWIDPFILLDTKNLDETVKLAGTWRLSSCWQKCNSSKKFIILEEYYDEFCEKLADNFSKLKIWDPFETETVVWPISSLLAVKELEEITHNAIKDWAKLLTGWKRFDTKWYYFEPTVICDVTPENSLFDTETFWPIASVVKAKNKEHAILLANNSKFWLTACVVSDDVKLFEEVAGKLETWNVFHNKIPTSYPFLPYGWVKDSWYWKELWERWIKNFCNEKIIVY
jgi:succinate-semialdehyde dehydrogenase/glutarate-semialdehyde dehydrogenase